MSIKIELEFETAWEARQALRELLGVEVTGLTAHYDPGAYFGNATEDNYDSVKETKDDPNLRAPEPTAEEPAKRKRRTKAEIAADEEAARKAAEGKSSSVSVGTATDTIETNNAALSDAQSDEEAAPLDFEAARAAWEAADFPAYQAKFPSAAPDAPTFLRVLLQRVVDKIGMDAAREFMVTFGYGRVSEIPADKRDDFYDAVCGVFEQGE